MKGVLFIVVTLVTYAYSNNDTSNIGIKGIEVKCESKYEHKVIKQFLHHPGYDFVKFLPDFKEPIEVLITDKNFHVFQNVLKENNIAYKNFASYYPSYDKIKQVLHEYAKHRPNQATVFEIGNSFEKRKILGMKLSSGGKNKPSIIIDAGIHGRDWISTTAALTIIGELVRKTENTHLYENVDIYIFPLINPDGYEYTRQGPETRLWKKTRSVYRGSQCIGADLNRNFDVFWNSVGTSFNPCSNIYPGPWLLSEKEAINLSNFMLGQKNIRAHLSLRSNGNSLLYPFAYSFLAPNNIAKLKCVAEEAKKAIFTVRKTDYLIGTFAVFATQVSGTIADWAITKAGADVSYVMNLSSKKFKFTPPPSEMIPVGLEAFQAFKTFLDYAEGRLCENV